MARSKAVSASSYCFKTACQLPSPQYILASSWKDSRDCPTLAGPRGSAELLETVTFSTISLVSSRARSLIRWGTASRATAERVAQLLGRRGLMIDIRWSKLGAHGAVARLEERKAQT